MRIVFFGSDDFAAAHLDALINSRHNVCAIITQPDRPKGRGMNVVIPPPKQLGIEKGIEVLQPEDIKRKDLIENLKAFHADIFVVIAYGKFLPDELLAVPKIYPINVHGSILPKLRGAGPINWAIINGLRETGITVAKINSKMDSGDILAIKKISIKDDDDAVSLRREMIEIGPGLLLDTIDIIEKGECVSFKQNESQATYAPKLTKDMGHIDWSKKAVDIQNLIRGLVPWPNAYTYYNRKVLKIFSSEVVKGDMSKHFGEVIDVNGQGVIVQTGEDALFIKEVHLESSNRMTVKDFLSGHNLSSGFIFDNYK